MAVVYEEKVSKVRSFKCDRCGNTTLASLSSGLQAVRCGGDLWTIMENDRVLCPDCVKAIVEAWYNQKEIGNFQPQGSVGEPKKRKKRVVA